MFSHMSTENGRENRLGGWKAIAVHLARSVRTTQRWEAEAGLPVRRLGTGSVFAYRHDLDAWLASEHGRAVLAEDDALPAARTTPPSDIHAVVDPQPLPPVGRPGGPSLPMFDAADQRRQAFWRGLLAAVGLLAVLGASAAFTWVLRPASMPALVCPGDCVVRQGQTIVLRADGAAPTDAFLRWIKSENGHVESFRPALTPDAQGTVTWGFTTDCSSRPGAYEVRFVRDHANVPTNTVLLRILAEDSCAAPVADLVAEGVACEPLILSADRHVSCGFTLRNQGAAAAPASVARLRLGTSPDRTPVTDRMLGDVLTPAVAPGTSVRLEGRFAVPVDAAAGVPFYVWVIADNGSAVLERVGVNNFAHSSALTIASGATAARR